MLFKNLVKNLIEKEFFSKVNEIKKMDIWKRIII